MTLHPEHARDPKISVLEIKKKTKQKKKTKKERKENSAAVIGKGKNTRENMGEKRERNDGGRWSKCYIHIGNLCKINKKYFLSKTNKS